MIITPDSYAEIRHRTYDTVDTLKVTVNNADSRISLSIRNGKVAAGMAESYFTLSRNEWYTLVDEVRQLLS